MYMLHPIEHWHSFSVAEAFTGTTAQNNVQRRSCCWLHSFGLTKSKVLMEKPGERAWQRLILQ